jgi:hypothetical protein
VAQETVADLVQPAPRSVGMQQAVANGAEAVDLAGTAGPDTTDLSLQPSQDAVPREPSQQPAGGSGGRLIAADV